MRSFALLALIAMAAGAQQPERRWKFLHANELQTPWMSIRVGAGFLAEVASYQQDEASRLQLSGGVTPDTGSGADARHRTDTRAFAQRALAASLSAPGELPTAGRVRDSRFLFSGRLMTKRPISWQAGLFYDMYAEKWLVRQTGFVISVPEISSNFWVGRTKEGPSLNRVMVGYDGWTMERFTFSDAAIPLLADGIRWQGYLPSTGLFWNLGYFVDLLSEAESFSYFSNQLAGRVGYVKIDSAEGGSVLHLGVGFHAGIPDHGILQLKSKPEASGAPNFVDTGKFPASAAHLVGVEAYYRPGSWLFGTEYYLERATSPETNNPVFHGGDISATRILTGESRPYAALGSVFRDIVPARSVFAGGPGALEVLMRLSYIDLDDGTLRGGKFWRLTPGVNWYLSGEVRLELGYGYGVLDRFELKGATHFFQSRLQLQM